MKKMANYVYIIHNHNGNKVEGFPGYSYSYNYFLSRFVREKA